MLASPRCGLGLLYPLNLLLLACSALNLSSSSRTPGTADKALLQAQDFLSHFLATMNLTEPQRPKRHQYRALSGADDTPVPDYMQQLYRDYIGSNGAAAVPSATVVRSFQNEGMLRTKPYELATCMVSDKNQVSINCLPANQTKEAVCFWNLETQTKKNLLIALNDTMVLCSMFN